GSPAAACAACVFAFFGLWQLLIIRPQTLSLLLFVVLLNLLDGAGRRRWLLAFPPLVMALWVNLHGGFPIGLVLLGAWALGELAGRWLQPSGPAEDGGAGAPPSPVAALVQCWPWF